MDTYNNIKKVREIYGATQEEVAKAIGVNRTTISQWENGSIKASNSNLEKLSLFFCIGPECFYDLPEIDDERRLILTNTAQKQREIQNKSGNERSKSDDFNTLFASTTFKEARNNFMIAMKVMLATSDDATLEDLNLSLQINEKMMKRLKAIIQIREEEQSEGDTLAGLIEQIPEK